MFRAPTTSIFAIESTTCGCAPAAIGRHGRPMAATTNVRSLAAPSDSAIPTGTELDVRLAGSLSSKTNVVEDRFRATTAVDLTHGRSRADSGRIRSPRRRQLGRKGRTARSQGADDARHSIRLTIDGRDYPIQGTIVDPSKAKASRVMSAKIGAGAGVGAIIGGILGGAKGAIAGILIGGGGIAAATPGKDIELTAGTILRVRLDEPPAIR